MSFHPSSAGGGGTPSGPPGGGNGGGAYTSRRVTIGGMQGSGGVVGGGGVGPSSMMNPHHHSGPTAPPTMLDRRGSLASSGFEMDDIFGGRRGSLGFDMGMENLFARRGSMDSTTAVLDAAIFDLTRKRYSMAMGGTGGPGDHLMGGSGPGGGGGGPGGVPGPSNLSSMGSMGSLGGGLGGMGGPPTSGFNPNYGFPPPTVPQSSSASSIAARQQQLQDQQRDLERRQKELEVARQQLIASMQERNSYMGGGGGVPGGGPPQTISAQFPPPHHGSGSLGWGGGGGPGGGGAYQRNSLDFSGRGLDLSHRGTPSMDYSGRGIPSIDQSHRGGGLGFHPTAASALMDQHSQRSITIDQSHRSSNASSTSQWWVCQVCSSKAFASHEEAMEHEAICQDGPRMGPGGVGRRHDPMDPLSGSRDGATAANRNYSLGTMDSSSHSAYEQTTYSTGPFADLDHPMPLSMPSDKDWLTPLHCFVRRHCVEVFTASEYDVATPSKGKRKPITVGQVGIRCPHCHSHDEPVDHAKARERGSVYFPTTIASIYNATMNLLQRHLHCCTAVPENVMRRYETLKADDARSGTSKKYWIESARSLGLVDTAMGIRFSALGPPPPPAMMGGGEGDASYAQRRNSNDFFSSASNALTVGTKDHMSGGGAGRKGSTSGRGSSLDGTASSGHESRLAPGPLVTPSDKPYSTSFSYHLLSQMQPCVFTEADRLGKRKGLPPGFPGLACRHCFGGYGSGRFFPSSIKTLSDTSKTLNVLHNHMMRCRKCPAEVRETLEKLRGSHDDERAKMKFGSQKAFFARIWDRLHGKEALPGSAHLSSPHHGSDEEGHHHRPSKGKRKAPPPPPSTPPTPHGYPMVDDSARSGHSMMSSQMPPQTGDIPTNSLEALAHASDAKRQKMV